MINFRYHIISITAVFLALGLGLALGTGFGNRVLLTNLTNTQHNLDREVHEKRARNAQLEKELAQKNARAEKFLDSAVHTTLMKGRLDKTPVLVVAPKGIDERYLNTLRTGIESAGADFAGSLRLDARLQLDGDNKAKLARILGSTSTDATVLRRDLVRALSEVFTTDGAHVGDRAPGATTTTSTTSTTIPAATLPGETTLPPVTVPTTTVPLPIEPPLITALREGGFLQFEPPSGVNKSEVTMSSGGFRYVFYTAADPAVPDSDLLMPLLRAMAANGSVPVVVSTAATGADPEKTRTDVVGPIRQDSTLADRVSTVDDVESFDGVAATVLSLGEVGAGRHGHYGVGDGASAPLPPVTGGP